ncbi:MAG TPA: hypothetical protein VFP22_00365 [Candidatus Limnocylindrales bacterium]|nr:hypothetical protein [Candidatus Limnocylindrales bacterium]
MSPTATTPATAATAARDRDPDLILARAHLRLGSLGLARAELETLAGRARLDDDGIRDLAEARWRTGDTAGAGEAAAAFLEVAPDDVIALVISAEAQADLGRPAEARRLAGKALGLAEGSLDPVFAGMRRSSVWPVEAGASTGPIGLLFDDLHPEPIRPDAAPDRRAGDRPASPSQPPHAPLDPGIPADLEGAPRLWDDDDPALGRDRISFDADTLFHRARTALDAGQAATAATGLILALRTSPDLAPAVLDLLSGRAEPILVLVRGDAERIVGREAESIRDHAAAARRVAELAAPAAIEAPEAADDTNPAPSPSRAVSDEPSPDAAPQEDS